MHVGSSELTSDPATTSLGDWFPPQPPVDWRWGSHLPASREMFLAKCRALGGERVLWHKSHTHQPWQRLYRLQQHQLHQALEPPGRRPQERSRALWRGGWGEVLSVPPCPGGTFEAALVLSAGLPRQAAASAPRTRFGVGEQYVPAGLTQLDKIAGIFWSQTSTPPPPGSLPEALLS